MPSFIPAPPTKEFFAPATGGTKLGNVSSYTGYLLDADFDVARVPFMIPHDFHAVVAAELVWIAISAVTNMFIDGRARYGGHGEHYNTHNVESDVTRTTTADRIYRDDVKAALAQASPLDHVGFAFGRPGGGNTNALILGVRVRYT